MLANQPLWRPIKGGLTLRHSGTSLLSFIHRDLSFSISIHSRSLSLSLCDNGQIAAAAVGRIIWIWHCLVSRPSKCALSAVYRGREEERRGWTDCQFVGRSACRKSRGNVVVLRLRRPRSYRHIGAAFIRSFVPPLDIVSRIIPSHRSHSSLASSLPRSSSRR